MPGRHHSNSEGFDRSGGHQDEGCGLERGTRPLAVKISGGGAELRYRPENGHN